MAKVPGNRQLSGTYGKLFWDGEEIFEVDKVEAKLELKREPVAFVGDAFEDSKVMGMKGAGSFTIKHIYSRGIEKLGKAFKEGKDPRSTLLVAVEDPDAFGSERVILKNVAFNEVILAQFETGQKLTRAFPFSFTEFDFPDTIEVK